MNTRFPGLRKSSRSIAVTSAAAISPERKKSLETALANRYPGTDLCFSYELDPEVIGGVCLKTEGCIIDTSFRKKLDELCEYLFDAQANQCGSADQDEVCDES